MRNMQRKHKAALQDEKRTFTVEVLISHRMSNRNERSEDQILTQMFILSLSDAFLADCSFLSFHFLLFPLQHSPICPFIGFLP